MLDAMIETLELTKRYGRTVAVDALSFQAKPGQVTGFLGPNGAGKSTTMRLLLGLDTPTSGAALVHGRPYRSFPCPSRVVGVLLDAGAAHGDRTAFMHAYALARSNGIGRRRVAEVLDQVGLASVAHRRVRGFSLGMRQRLGVAVALLGDPGVLLLDEPANGLDPEGIQWIRRLMRRLAAEGRTVLVSSHLMSEMAFTVDAVVVIGRGCRLVSTTMSELAERFKHDVFTRSPDQAALADALTHGGGKVEVVDGGLSVTGITAATVGDLANRAGATLHELTPRSASLEDLYLDLTGRHTAHGPEVVA